LRTVGRAIEVTAPDGFEGMRVFVVEIDFQYYGIAPAEGRVAVGNRQYVNDHMQS